MGTRNLGQGTGRELGAGTWDRELGAGNWGQQTGDRELGTGGDGEATTDEKGVWDEKFEEGLSSVAESEKSETVQRLDRLLQWQSSRVPASVCCRVSCSLQGKCPVPGLGLASGRSTLAVAGVFGAGKTRSLTFLLAWFAITTNLRFGVAHKENPAGRAITKLLSSLDLDEDQQTLFVRPVGKEEAVANTASSRYDKAMFHCAGIMPGARVVQRVHLGCAAVPQLQQTERRPGASTECPRPLACVRGAWWPFEANGQRRL